jgi:hypothetical protein
MAKKKISEGTISKIITYDDWLVEEEALEEDETLLVLHSVRFGETNELKV